MDTITEEAEVERAERALVVRQPDSQELAEWTPRFALSVDEAVERVEQKNEFFRRVMKPGVHYGNIPNVEKPSLSNAGAELLLSSMSLHPTFHIEDKVVDLSGEDHGGEAFVSYDILCRVWRQTGPGPEDRMLVAEGTGECNSHEKKYRWRPGQRVCPECGVSGSVIKGKAEYGGGWLCWGKKGGCGEKFAEADSRITKQEVGDVPNPDLADLVNTIKKMAAKRAKVAATLNATGCSDIFTQDLEDAPPVSGRPGVVDGEFREVEPASSQTAPAAPANAATATITCPHCGKGTVRQKRNGARYCSKADGGCGKDVDAAATTRPAPHPDTSRDYAGGGDEFDDPRYLASMEAPQ